MTPKSIWHRRRLLDRARRDRQEQLMQEYDATEYRPYLLMQEYDATEYRPYLLALQDECGRTATGHTRGTHHDNGLGWHWWYCGRCDARHGVQQHTRRTQEST
jgi:hypothetical protein